MPNDDRIVVGRELFPPKAIDIGSTMSATIRFEQIEPHNFWEVRHQLHDQMVASMEVFEGMSDNEREALVNRVRQAIVVMHDQIDNWLPDALKMDSTGCSIRVELNFITAEIEADVRLLEQATSFQVKESVAGTKETLAELAELRAQMEGDSAVAESA